LSLTEREGRSVAILSGENFGEKRDPAELHYSGKKEECLDSKETKGKRRSNLFRGGGDVEYKREEGQRQFSLPFSWKRRVSVFFFTVAKGKRGQQLELLAYREGTCASNRTLPKKGRKGFGYHYYRKGEAAGTVLPSGMGPRRP